MVRIQAAISRWKAPPTWPMSSKPRAISCKLRAVPTRSKKWITTFTLKIARNCTSLLISRGLQPIRWLMSGLFTRPMIILEWGHPKLILVHSGKSHRARWRWLGRWGKDKGVPREGRVLIMGAGCHSRNPLFSIIKSLVQIWEGIQEMKFKFHSLDLGQKEWASEEIKMLTKICL